MKIQIQRNVVNNDYIWDGPFEGYIQGTPVNEYGKNTTIFCKTLEEAQRTAEEYVGIVRGVTQVNENKFSLRFGNKIICSPKKEKSWFFVNGNTQKTEEPSHGLPEDEEVWTEEQHNKYKEWEELENKKWYISKIKKKEDNDVFQLWIYNHRIILLNPFTNEVKDKDTLRMIGKRLVLKNKNDKKSIVEVFIWSIMPYFHN
jgi:hypothetical protein